MRIVLAMTGASGSLYGLRLADVLRAAGCHVHLVISPAGAQVLHQETGAVVDLTKFDVANLFHSPSGGASGQPEQPPGADVDEEASSGLIEYHHYMNFNAGIASGSYLTDGMVICPCSMGTLASVAHGLSSNLIQRAADVHLKERRKLILVPRETPLGSIQLENMKRLADAGAVILPAMPGFYHRPTSISELVDFIVARICDQLGVRHSLARRWGSSR